MFTAVIGADVIPGVKVNTAFRNENTLRTMMELLSMKAFPAGKGRCSDERIFQVAGGWITAETPQGSLFR